jgi:hypothetical protein
MDRAAREIRVAAGCAARSVNSGPKRYPVGAMPLYRLIFPTPPNLPIEATPTAEIDSGDEVYEVGAIIAHGGKRWRVSQAPVELPERGDTAADLMVWPAE